MLKAIELENFKAFGNRVRIELAPITLIYGQNSAGKSSILHALNLLKQSRSGNEVSILSARREGGITDLGSYGEMVFDHDTSRMIRIAFELESSEHGPGGEAPEEHSVWNMHNASHWHPPYRIEASWRYDESSKEVALFEVGTGPAHPAGSIALFRMRPHLKEDYVNVPQYRPGGILRPNSKSVFSDDDPTRVAECVWLSDDESLWTPIYNFWFQHRNELAEVLRGRRPSERQPSLFAERRREEEELTEQEAKASNIAAEFYEKPFTLAEFMSRMRDAWLRSLATLNSDLEPSVDNLRSLELPEFERLHFRSQFGRHPRELNWAYLSPVHMLGVSAGGLREVLDSYFPLGPFRHPPARYYTSSGTAVSDVGLSGNRMPDLLFRNPKLIEAANGWLRRLGIDYEIRVRPLGDKYADLFEIRLADTRRRSPVEVALTDVGFGVSQILPFVIQSVAASSDPSRIAFGRLISIEQPEVHIHPRLQADLGDLMAECTKRIGHQYLVETHSENLVLRMQRLVREGRLAPEDVSVIYVERGPDGSRAQRLHLDRFGEFTDEWPGGFFPERLRELM